MGGKAILFLVMGFSLIFLVMGQNFGSISTEAVSNFSNYYAKDISHQIALSGANMAASKIYFDNSWTTGFQNLKFENGILDVNVEIVDAFKNIRRINSTGIFSGDTSVVQVTLKPGNFAQYAYYSVDENGIWWTTGDTVNGPFHTQDYLHVSGHPVFKDITSTRLGLVKYHSQSGYGMGSGSNTLDDPEFDGPFSVGDSIGMPESNISDLETAASSGGHTFFGHDTVYLNFKKDSIQYKFSYNGNVTTKLGSDLSPNGVIFADDATLRIEGTVSGQYTVGASDSTISIKNGGGNSYGWGGGNSGTTTTTQSDGRGNIYIDDNIVYNSVSSSSQDMLGIVAKNNVYVSKNVPHQDIHIDAAIYSQTGGFEVEDYNKTYNQGGPLGGSIFLLGGITQNLREPVGTFNPSTNEVSTGYNKSYNYDSRFKYSSPPSFPGTGSFVIASWYE